jgi:hypothetical protein
MNQEIYQLITDFNNTLLDLALNIANICPSSIIGTNIKDIEKTIKRKDLHSKFIDIFCVKVLKYKDEIDSGEESFFMDKDYSSDLSDQDSSLLNHVLSLKSIWKLLKKDNKEIVIMNMQILCALAQQYFEFIASTIKN